MGNTVATATFSIKLLKHCLTMGNPVTFLAERDFAVHWMAESTGLLGMTRIAGHERVIHFAMASCAALFRLFLTKDKGERVMGVVVASQAISVLQTSAMTICVMTVEARRNLAMLGMTTRASHFGVML